MIIDEYVYCTNIPSLHAIWHHAIKWRLISCINTKLTVIIKQLYLIDVIILYFMMQLLSCA